MSNNVFLKMVASNNPFVWVNSNEYDRVISSLSHIVREKLEIESYVWDTAMGIRPAGSINGSNDGVQNPLAPIEFIKTKGDNNVVFVLDYDSFIKEVVVYRNLLNSLSVFQGNNCTFVVVSPNSQVIPNNVRSYCTVLDFELPTKEELLLKIEEFVALVKEKHNVKVNLSDEEKNSIARNGQGLTLYEFENAISYSLSESRTISADTVYKQKEQLIKKQSGLEVCKFDKGFEAIAGLEVMKDFGKKITLSGNGKGFVVVGQPGTGKSLYSKCLGNETDRITICLNFEDLMGSLVGETEAKTKSALAVIDAMAPCVLFIDEFEKGISGASGSNGDSGTARRQGGTFLKWLSDHTSDVIVVATTNDISSIPDEFLRAERWDSIFFVDLPNSEEIKALVDMYKKIYNISEVENINYEGWTGAEVKSLCRIASSLSITLEEAQGYVTHVSEYAAEKVESLRKWAKGRTIPASKPSMPVVNINNNGNNGGGRKLAFVS